MFKSCLSGLCFFLTVCLCHAAEEEVVLVEHVWPPWTSVDEETNAPQGIAVEIAQTIFSQIPGFQPKIELYPWKRCLFWVKEGRKDALLLAAYNEERAGYAQYTDEIARNKAILMHRQGHPLEWHSLADFKHYKIGVVGGNDYGKTFADAAEEHAYQVNRGSNSVAQGLAMLERNRFDVFLTTEFSARAAFKIHPELKDALAHVNSPFSDGDIYYMAFSKKSPHVTLVPTINEIISQMKSEGVIDAIIDKHMN